MRISFLLFVALVMVFPGCKKDQMKMPTCRISKLVSPDAKEIRITYNTEGKYSKIENDETGETNIVFYGPGSIIYAITNNTTGKLSRKLTVTLNSSGMASSMVQELYNSAGIRTSMANLSYDYTGTELLKSTSIISGRMAPIVNTYQWTNGNMTSSFDGTSAATYEYYTAEAIQPCDWLSIINLISVGIDYTLVLKNKNLIKEYFGTVFSYRFDEDGKIKALYNTGSLFYNIEYECQ